MRAWSRRGEVRGKKAAGESVCKRKRYRTSVVTVGGAQRRSCAPVLCPLQSPTDLEHSWRNSAGEGVSALTGNLQRAEGVPGGVGDEAKLGSPPDPQL